jgi:hypothetical protein
MNTSRRTALTSAASAGLATLAAGVASADGQKIDDRWRAWAVTEGEHTKLVVEGIYAQGGPGVVVLVKPAVPQGFNPKILILDVKPATLPGVWPAILQPVPADFTLSPYKKDQYTSIHLRYPGGQGSIMLKIIDTGKGPDSKGS